MLGYFPHWARPSYGEREKLKTYLDKMLVIRTMVKLMSVMFMMNKIKMTLSVP